MQAGRRFETQAPANGSRRNTGAMATRVSSARVVGRGRELAELEAALADAAQRKPSIAFVAGESGVGKTRLLVEFERRAQDTSPPARVIGGDCVELGEGELPYAPLVAALRPLAREQDPVVAALPEATRGELGALLPGLAPARADEPSSERDDAAQGRLFEALLTLFDSLGEDQPLLLAIEDIHWADRSTRAFLAFLARSMSTERLLVVATYRPDELHRRHPLRPVLAELERDAARPAHRAGAAHSRRAARAAHGHPRRPAGGRPGRAPVVAQRGQPALHRGAARRRARRPRIAAADDARRADGADRAPQRRHAGAAAGAGRRAPPRRGADERRQRPRRAAAAGRAARGGGQPHRRRRRRRLLPLPPRAAARGGARRPAARRARRAAPGAGARARDARRGARQRRAS